MRITRSLICLVALLLILTAFAPRVQAIPTIKLQACRDVTVQNLGASGVQANPVGCGREFPISIPYVVLFIEIERIDYSTVFAWQLYTPTDEVYARFRRQLSSDTGMWNLWGYYILPVASTEKEIVDKTPRFRGAVLEVGAKPVSEMPGEWRLQASLGGGSPMVLRFTLKP